MAPPPTAYCVKCKDTKRMLNPTRFVASNGRPMTRGTCACCGTKVCTTKV